jgi:hypothetical protein
MRITEGQLRRIVKESILNEDERRRAEMMAAVAKEIDFKKDLSKPGSEVTKSFSSYEARREEKGRVAAERRLKSLWNKYADHEFFDQKLAKLHAIGLYGNNSASCLNFLDAYAGKVNRDEVSTLGWRESKLTTGWTKSHDFTFGVFIDGRVTYASSDDIATEWTSNATESDRQRHASSGLPKRPYYIDNSLVADHLVLDEEDWVERIESWGTKSIMHELIVDNWRIKSLVVHSLSRAGYRVQQDAWQTDNFLISVFSKCKQLGIPIMDEAGTLYYSPGTSFDEDLDGDWDGNEDLSRGLA